MLWRFGYAVFIGLQGVLVGSVVGLAFATAFHLWLFRGTLTQVVVYIIGASCIASGLISAVAFHVWRHDGSEMISIFVMPVVAAITAVAVKVWMAVHRRSW